MKTSFRGFGRQWGAVEHLAGGPHNVGGRVLFAVPALRRSGTGRRRRGLPGTARVRFRAATQGDSRTLAATSSRAIAVHARAHALDGQARFIAFAASLFVFRTPGS